MIVAVLAIVTISCKKNSENPAPVTQADYFQLKVGNYWIYQGFTSDSTGVFTPTGKYDSAYIENDTLIRGFTYHKLVERPWVMSPQMPNYLRDSSGYLVDSRGYIIASDFNFTDILEIDTINIELFKGFLQMTGRDSVVTIPAGAFKSITSRYKTVPSPPNTANFPIRYSYDIYGKGVGEIKTHTFLWSGFMQMEARLVRYKVN